MRFQSENREESLHFFSNVLLKSVWLFQFYKGHAVRTIGIVMKRPVSVILYALAYESNYLGLRHITAYRVIEKPIGHRADNRRGLILAPGAFIMLTEE